MMTIPIIAEAPSSLMDLATRAGGTLLGSLLAGAVLAIAAVPAMRAWMRSLALRQAELDKGLLDLSKDLTTEALARAACRTQCAEIYTSQGALGEHQRRNDEHFQLLHDSIRQDALVFRAELAAAKVELVAESRNLHSRVTEVVQIVSRYEGRIDGLKEREKTDGH